MITIDEYRNLVLDHIKNKHVTESQWHEILEAILQASENCKCFELDRAILPRTILEGIYGDD